jgi:hypothetical protein
LGGCREVVLLLEGCPFVGKLSFYWEVVLLSGGCPFIGRLSFCREVVILSFFCMEVMFTVCMAVFLAFLVRSRLPPFRASVLLHFHYGGRDPGKSASDGESPARLTAASPMQCKY